MGYMWHIDRDIGIGINIDVDIDFFKELAHIIMRAGKSEICRIGWQAGN